MYSDVPRHSDDTTRYGHRNDDIHGGGGGPASPMEMMSPHGMSRPNRSLRRELGGNSSGHDHSNLDSTEHWTTFNQTSASYPGNAASSWSPHAPPGTVGRTPAPEYFSPNQTAATDSTLGFSTMLPHLAAPLLGLGVPRASQQHRLSPVQQSPAARRLHAAASDLEARIGATAGW